MSACTWLQEFSCFVFKVWYSTREEGYNRLLSDFSDYLQHGPVLYGPQHTNSTTCSCKAEVSETLCFTTCSCNSCMYSGHRQKGWQPHLLESAGTSHCSGFTFNAWNCQQVELLCPKINLFKRDTCLGLIFFFPSRQGEQGNWKRWDRTVLFSKMAGEENIICIN